MHDECMYLHQGNNILINPVDILLNGLQLHILNNVKISSRTFALMSSRCTSEILLYPCVYLVKPNHVILEEYPKLVTPSMVHKQYEQTPTPFLSSLLTCATRKLILKKKGIEICQLTTECLPCTQKHTKLGCSLGSINRKEILENAV